MSTSAGCCLSTQEQVLRGRARSALATGAWPVTRPSCVSGRAALDLQHTHIWGAAAALEKGEKVMQLLGRLPTQRELKQALQGCAPLLRRSHQAENRQTGRGRQVPSEKQYGTARVHAPPFYFSNTLWVSVRALERVLAARLSVCAHSPPSLPHVARTDLSPRHEWADCSENPQHWPLCGLEWVQRFLSKKQQLQLQCSRRVTREGGAWQGSAECRHGPPPTHPASWGRPCSYGLCLSRRQAHLYPGSSWEALGLTDGAGNKKWGLGQASGSSGRERERGDDCLWNCERMVSGGEEGCCGRNDSVLWKWYFC